MRLGRHGVLIAAVVLGCSTASPTVLPTPNASQEPVPAGPPLAGRIEVTPSAVLLTGAGQSAQLTADATQPDGAQPPVTWTSSDPAQVSVDATGRVTSATDLGGVVVFAEAGDRWASVVVLIAQPPAGAVLVDDDQVAAQPAPLVPDKFPENGDRLRVTLRNVDAPAAGTILLATGSTPLAGRVVTAQAATDGTVQVEYELIPLPQLLARYDFSFALPVDPRDAGLTGVASAAQFASVGPPEPVPAPVYDDEWEAEKKAEFKKGPLTCTASAAAKFKSTEFGVTVTNNLTLQIEGKKEVESASTPEHTKVVLTGPIAVDVIGGLRAEAGFEGKAECEVKHHIPIPLGGILAAVLALTVPVGLTAGVQGTVKAVDVELGPVGHLGTNVSVGFQCDGQACWAIEEYTPDKDNGVNFKTKVNLLRDMRVDASVGLNIVTGLGLHFGTNDYGLIDAKIGPVQALSLAFEGAQVRETGYASAYDLKIAGSIEPADDLKKAIGRVFGGAVTVNFGLKYESDALAQSPKGTLSAEKARVQVDKPVKLTVDLAPIDYLFFKPNVAQVRIDRWKDGELKNVTTMPMSATGQTRFDYVWTPNKDFVGMNELVAFVITEGLPAVPLEIAPDSRAYVEVVEACLADPPTPGPPVPTAVPGSSAPVAPTAPPEDLCAADVTITHDSTSFLREGHITITGNLERYVEGETALGPDQPVDDFVGTGTVTGSAVGTFAMALSGKPLCDQDQIWATANSVDVYLTATDIPEGWPGFNGPALLVAVFDAQTEPPFSVIGLGGAAPRGGGSHTVVYERIAVDECGDKMTETTTVTVAPGVAAP